MTEARKHGLSRRTTMVKTDDKNAPGKYERSELSPNEYTASERNSGPGAYSFQFGDDDRDPWSYNDDYRRDKDLDDEEDDYLKDEDEDEGEDDIFGNKKPIWSTNEEEEEEEPSESVTAVIITTPAPEPAPFVPTPTPAPAIAE